MPKVKHVSDFMVDVWSDREWGIEDICKKLEKKLNKEKATIAGSPILTTNSNSNELLHITIPYFPNSGNSKIRVKYFFRMCNGPYYDALKKFDIEKIESDYPISIRIFGKSKSQYRTIFAIWTETAEKRSSLTLEEIATFTKSAKANNKFAK